MSKAKNANQRSTDTLEWKHVEIGDLNPYVTSGSRGWANYYSEFGSTFVRITNLRREAIYLDTTDLRFVRLPAGSAEGLRTELKNGDLLVSITADIGIIGYVDERLPKPSYINQHIALIRFGEGVVNSKFLAYFLAARESQDFFKSTTDTGAKAGLNLNGIRKIKISFPPLPEQRAIAQALSDVDELINSLDKLIAKKRAIKQATMQELLTGKTRLPGFSDSTTTMADTELGMLPKGWSVQKLGDLGQWKGGITPSMANRLYWEGGNIPWASSGDVKVSRLRNTQQNITALAVREATSVLPKGSLLVVTRSGILRRYLPVCLNEVPVAINQDIKALIPTSQYSSEFLLHALIGFGPSILGSCLKSGTTVESIEFPWLKSFKIPMPPLTEQKALATCFNSMDELIVRLEKQKDKTMTLKQAMMQELLTGKTRLV